jgi:hypothetical protein
MSGSAGLNVNILTRLHLVKDIERSEKAFNGGGFAEIFKGKIKYAIGNERVVLENTWKGCANEDAPGVPSYSYIVYQVESYIEKEKRERLDAYT